jgi:Flp pilus assembly protein TadD
MIDCPASWSNERRREPTRPRVLFVAPSPRTSVAQSTGKTCLGCLCSDPPRQDLTNCQIRKALLIFSPVMKFASALFGFALLLAAGLHLRAAGPDDVYLEAYRLIQEGDKLIGTSQPELARQRYDRAEKNLKQLQVSYPNYSKQAVQFRLDYVREKMRLLPSSETPAPPAATTPRPAPSGAPSAAELTSRIAQLEADNQLLQAKLQEALAPRPAAVDPAEFAKATERVKHLEKDKELLRASLEQAQAIQPNAGEALMLEQTRAELESTRKKLMENINGIAALTRENQDLRQQALKAPVAAAPADDARAKDLEKERDALLKKLNDANMELSDVKSRGQIAGYQTLTNQISNLRARLEVYEARKVPFTKEEMALLDQDVPKLAATVDPKAGRKAPRELPAGAGLLIAEAERAFAARRYAEAEEKYKQVLNLDDENPISLANLAAIQLQLEKHDEADANIQKAVAAAPNDAYALSLLGMLRFQQGKYEEAFAALSRSAQLDPKNPETQNYLGITLSQQGQREAAETAIRKAIQFNPSYAAAHHNLAVIYATQRPPFVELAKYHYQRSLALGHPANPELEKQIGQ